MCQGSVYFWASHSQWPLKSVLSTLRLRSNSIHIHINHLWIRWQPGSLHGLLPCNAAWVCVLVTNIGLTLFGFNFDFECLLVMNKARSPIPATSSTMVNCSRLQGSCKLYFFLFLIFSIFFLLSQVLFLLVLISTIFSARAIKLFSSFFCAFLRLYSFGGRQLNHANRSRDCQ